MSFVVTFVDPSTGRGQSTISPCELRRHQEKPGDEEDESGHDGNDDTYDADHHQQRASDEHEGFSNHPLAVHVQKISPDERYVEQNLVRTSWSVDLLEEGYNRAEHRSRRKLVSSPAVVCHDSLETQKPM